MFEEKLSLKKGQKKKRKESSSSESKSSSDEGKKISVKKSTTKPKTPSSTRNGKKNIQSHRSSDEEDDSPSENDTSNNSNKKSISKDNNNTLVKSKKEVLVLKSKSIGNDFSTETKSHSTVIKPASENERENEREMISQPEIAPEIHTIEPLPKITESQRLSAESKTILKIDDKSIETNMALEIPVDKSEDDLNSEKIKNSDISNIPILVAPNTNLPPLPISPTMLTHNKPGRTNVPHTQTSPSPTREVVQQPSLVPTPPYDPSPPLATPAFMGFQTARGNKIKPPSAAALARVRAEMFADETDIFPPEVLAPSSSPKNIPPPPSSPVSPLGPQQINQNYYVRDSKMEEEAIPVKNFFSPPPLPGGFIGFTSARGQKLQPASASAIAAAKAKLFDDPRDQQIVTDMARLEGENQDPVAPPTKRIMGHPESKIKNITEYQIPAVPPHPVFVGFTSASGNKMKPPSAAAIAAAKARTLLDDPVQVPFLGEEEFGVAPPKRNNNVNNNNNNNSKSKNIPVNMIDNNNNNNNTGQNISKIPIPPPLIRNNKQPPTHLKI